MISRFKYYKLFFLIIFCCFLSFKSKSQNIKVFDFESKKPVQGALVKLYSLDSKLYLRKYTNDLGFISCDLIRPTRLNISHISYTTLDTIINEISNDTVFYIEKNKNPLKEVVVTAQIGEELVSKSVNNFLILSKKNIENSSSNNLVDLLSTQALFDINYDSFLGSGLSIQGLQGNNVKILIDGIPVIGRKGSQIDISQINLSNVDRIEILKGPAAVSYGTNSTGGVINLITNYNTGDYVNLNSYFENIGMYQINLNLKKSVNNQNFQLNIGSSDFSGFSEDTLRTLEWKPKKQLFGDFFWSKKINNNKIQFKTSIFEEEIIELGPENNPPFNGTAYDMHYTSSRKSNYLKFTKFSDFYDINSLISYSVTKFEKNQFFVDFNSDSSELIIDSEFNTKDFFKSAYARTEYNRSKSDNFKFQFGLDFNYELVGGSKIIDEEATIFEQSIFLQSNLILSSKLNTKIGIRIPNHSIYSAPVIPSFNIKYDFHPRLIFRQSYATGFRAPSVKELFLEFIDSNHNIVGNINLEAEKSHAFQSSISYIPYKNNMNIISLNLEFFLNEMTNKINLAQIENSNAYTYYNLSNSTYTGLNFFLKTEIRKKNKFEFSWNRYRVKTNSLNYKLPKQNFSAFYSYYNDEFNFGFNINWKLKSKSEFERFNDLDELVTYEQESYQLLNASFQRNFMQINSTLKIGFKNIFDVRSIDSEIQGGVHDGSVSIISWGRTSFISFNYYPFRKD